MKADELLICDLFENRYGVDLIKIPESDQKSPDFYVKKNDYLIGVAELKTFIFEIPSVGNGWIETVNGILHKEKKDNGPAKVGRKIKEAYDQLSKYEYPKILIFLNKESSLDILDLHECYDGFLDYGRDKFKYRNYSSMEIAKGDIKNIKDKIDLYVWIEQHSKMKTYYRFTTYIGKDLAEKYFKSS